MSHARAKSKTCGLYTKQVLEKREGVRGDYPYKTRGFLNLGCRGTHTNRTNEKQNVPFKYVFQLTNTEQHHA